VPFVLQDYPLTFTVQISPGVIRRIVSELPSCVMLKHEDWPGLEKISTLRGYEQDGSMRRIAILCGNGGLFLDYEMERGADGANTGYCFPDMLCDVVRLSAAGEREQAHDLFDAHLPLLRYEQQPGAGLAVRKYVLMRRGLIACAAQRKPAAPMSEKTRGEVEHLLRRLARYDKRAELADHPIRSLSHPRVERLQQLPPHEFQLLRQSPHLRIVETCAAGAPKRYQPRLVRLDGRHDAALP
jgi:4-hydroxy-tetrahydrodipicolinate synthase